MSFFSTRGGSCVTASQAILYGLAPDKAFVIYQLREDSSAELRFMGLSRLQNPPDKDNYTPVYAGNLNPETDLSDETSRMLALEDLYSQFNADEKPEGFTGHSLSVSDVIIAVAFSPLMLPSRAEWMPPSSRISLSSM